jgi:hypothetical protein
LETIFWVKILQFFDADPGWRQFGSGIWDGKKSDPGPGINIPDPQHCQRRILCTLYGAVDFLIVPSKGMHVWKGGGGVEYVMLLYIGARTKRAAGVNGLLAQYARTDVRNSHSQ